MDVMVTTKLLLKWFAVVKAREVGVVEFRNAFVVTSQRGRTRMSGCLSEHTAEDERHHGGREDHQRARSECLDAVAEIGLAAGVRAAAHLALGDGARAADRITAPKAQGVSVC